MRCRWQSREHGPGRRAGGDGDGSGPGTSRSESRWRGIPGSRLTPGSLKTAKITDRGDPGAQKRRIKPAHKMRHLIRNPLPATPENSLSDTERSDFSRSAVSGLEGFEPSAVSARNYNEQ